MLGLGSLAPVLAALLGRARPADAAGPAADPAWRLSDSQWRQRLSPESYAVLRKEATERPFSSPLNAEKRPGTYRCAGCGLPLFSSRAKYDSGTGWPSFFAALPDAIGTRRDFKLIVPRTEYHCVRCGGHQGHLFNDGPRPSGKRYCNNGVALSFEAD
ncbi:MAG: peptide-methionine (R)-S-oxide reductase MsrB [Synechococcaceae cyanobacterium]